MTLAVVLGFALIVAVVFAVVAITYGQIYGESSGRRLTSHAIVIYPLLVLVPATLVVREPATADRLASWFGAPFGAPLVLALLVVALAAVLGVAMFYNELWLSATLLRPRKHRSQVDPIWEGRTEKLTAAQPALAVIVPVTLLVTVAEELVWRGYLVDTLHDNEGFAIGAALVLSSVAFGLNHFYFGARNAVLKTFDGFVWGALFVVSGSLWPSIVSHASFSGWVWYRLRARAGRQSAAHPEAPGPSEPEGQRVHAGG